MKEKSWPWRPTARRPSRNATAVRIDALIENRLERGREMRGDAARGERRRGFFALFERDLGREAVPEGAELRGVERREALSDQRRDHAGQKIAGAAVREARVAARIDPDFARRIGDQRAMPFKHADRVRLFGELAHRAQAI